MASRYVRAITVRRLRAGSLIDTFLISAATCMLTIRAALAATGWPQLGNDTLHIAHMLWGGLGMLVALLLLFALPSRYPLNLAAFVGGLGFGAFIDELGKFITSDNDYFFQPTIGLVYMIFIVLYLTARMVGRNAHPSAATYMVNALDLAKESFVTGIDNEKRETALEYLSRCDQSDSAVVRFQEFFRELQPLEEGSRNWLQRLAAGTQRLYVRLTGMRFFNWLIAGVVVVFVVANAAWLVSLTVGWREPFANAQDLSFGQTGQVIGTTISGILALVGIALFWKSRLLAYRLFDFAVLASIFITQIFRFWEHELQALAGLIISILLHLILAYAIAREQQIALDRERTGAGEEGK